MSLIDVIGNYLDHILGGIGQGMKSLLMDVQTMSAISVACPQSQLMSKDVYLFEKLSERRRSKQMSFITCICIAAPSNENIAQLKQELKSPRFGRYHIFFTRYVARALLKEIAECDPLESVKSINEIPLNFCALEAHVFSVARSPVIEETEGIISLLKACNMRPMICSMKTSSSSQKYAEILQEQLSRNPMEHNRDERPTTLLLFDRKLDPITPLLTQWTYQAMIHELFGIKGNLVDLSEFEVPKDLQKIVLSSQVDEFFCSNMYKDFGEIGEIIRKLVADFQGRMKSHQQNIENISDIKDFISNYPEFKKMSGTVSKHVNLVGEISKIVTASKLLQVSEYEQNLCSDQVSSSDDGILKDLLTNPNVRIMDKKKLLALYFVKKNYNFPAVAQHLNLVSRETGIDKMVLEKMLRNLKSYSLMKSSRVSSNPTVMDTKKFIKGLRGIENVYTQHQPVLQSILEDLMKKKVVPDVNYPSNFNNMTNNIVVYVIDGFTYEESKVLRNLNAELNGNLVIGGTKAWRSEAFLSVFTD